MQSHSAVCALEYRTVSWVGSSRCFAAAPFMCTLGISVPASFKLESPNTFFRTEGKEDGCLPMKTKCFEEKQVKKAVDVLGV